MEGDGGECGLLQLLWKCGTVWSREAHGNVLMLSLLSKIYMTFYQIYVKLSSGTKTVTLILMKKEVNIEC